MSHDSHTSTAAADAKSAYAHAVAGNDVSAMLAHAQQLLAASPSLAIAQQIANTLPLELSGRAAVMRKVAILRSFTVETSIPFLRALAAVRGIGLTIRVGDFNTYPQEIIEAHSWLYEFDPQIIILAVLTRDAVPQLWTGNVENCAAGAESQADECVARFKSLLNLLRSRSTASIIVQNFEVPMDLSAGIMDARQPLSQSDLIRSINRALCAEALNYSGVYILDYDGLVSRHGRANWTDEKKWLTSRAPISSGCLIHWAREYLKFLVPLCGRQAKVLVVDLDNTLWGGVVGEDGLDGIKIGKEYPGATYLQLQRAILDIAGRGVLLAICSKNNPNDALEALEGHAEMLLRPRHFAAMRINWNDKSENLREIAIELNVGLDTIAFLDDNPAERQRVRFSLPEVAVIDLPEDPAGYASVLRAAAVFERSSITAEDRERGKLYHEQRERSQLAASANSIEDFYRSLEMHAELSEVTSSNLARIAQLTQKTNQLNMTTRRYTESDVIGMLQDSTWSLCGIRVVDKFGDNGIVGTMFLRTIDDTLEIDTFVLSCRVIGRTVESAMLAQACSIARARDCSRLTGWFLPTQKNKPAAGIYADHGFAIAGHTEQGTLWQFDVSKKMIETPPWIRLTSSARTSFDA
jgi:FkbH-like protein